MTRPTDAAIALVREALHSGVLMHAAAPDDVIKTRAPGFSVDGALMRDRLVEGLLAHPTLARVIAIGQAWVAAEAALPEDYAMGEVWQRRDRTWEATARCFVKDKPYRMVPATGPTPEAALLALAAALTDQERGS